MLAREAPRIFRKARGAILLGDNVTCDGFAVASPVRVQTHIHADHMVDFGTSKANQTIVASRATRELLESIYNADLPYRSNLITLDQGMQMSVNGDLVELVSSGHMLGSSQVKVTCNDGYRIGYSSDFFWPLEPVIEVDELLVDATYGDPLRSRSYSQEQADACFLELLSISVASLKPTVVLSYNGRLQHALHLAASVVSSPIIVSPKAFPLVGVYQRHGFAIPTVIRANSAEGLHLARSGEPVVAFVTLPEQRHLPWVERFAKIHLSAHASKLDDPVTLYDNGDCCIALTDHADFAGTMEYVEASGAHLVWTDPRSGNAEALARAIREQLGIDAGVVPQLVDRGWG